MAGPSPRQQQQLELNLLKLFATCPGVITSTGVIDIPRLTTYSNAIAPLARQIRYRLRDFKFNVVITPESYLLGLAQVLANVWDESSTREQPRTGCAWLPPADRQDEQYLRDLALGIVRDQPVLDSRGRPRPSLPEWSNRYHT